jgi:hypothetical protein
VAFVPSIYSHHEDSCRKAHIKARATAVRQLPLSPSATGSSSIRPPRLRPRRAIKTLGAAGEVRIRRQISTLTRLRPGARVDRGRAFLFEKKDPFFARSVRVLAFRSDSSCRFEERRRVSVVQVLDSWLTGLDIVV